eukprot:6189662-Pleurochrysis_carterae.AAC.1
MYAVKTFPVKIDVNGVSRAKTVVRIHEESIRKIRELCPTLPPMPDEIPDSHRDLTQQARRGQSRSAGRRGRGTRGGRAGRSGRGGAQVAARRTGDGSEAESENTPTNSSDEEDAAVAAATAAAAANAEGLADDDDDDDDPPPSVPPGFAQEQWTPETRVEAGQHVLIWTSLHRRGRAAVETWHKARIQCELTSRAGSSSTAFTHDAVLTTERHPRGIVAAFTHDAVLTTERHPRGNVLSAETYEGGCWVLLE